MRHALTEVKDEDSVTLMIHDMVVLGDLLICVLVTTGADEGLF